MSSQEVFDFRKSGEARQAQAMRFELTRPVFLVGFMGAGKTSVARKLARKAGVAAIDMDSYIERQCDMGIQEIFETSGEEAFRAIESSVLAELVASSPQVVSCGGGIVLSEENRRLLKAGGFVVYLQVTAEEAASRISNLSRRPLFGNLERAQAIISERLPLYEEVADIIVDTAGKGTGRISFEALRLLEEAGILKHSDDQALDAIRQE